MNYIVLYKSRFITSFKVYKNIEEAAQLKKDLKEEGFLVDIVSTEQNLIV